MTWVHPPAGMLAMLAGTWVESLAGIGTQSHWAGLTPVVVSQHLFVAVVCCKVGRRSPTACSKLTVSGFVGSGQLMGQRVP